MCAGGESHVVGRGVCTFYAKRGTQNQDKAYATKIDMKLGKDSHDISLLL